MEDVWLDLCCDACPNCTGQVVDKPAGLRDKNRLAVMFVYLFHHLTLNANEVGQPEEKNLKNEPQVLSFYCFYCIVQKNSLSLFNYFHIKGNCEAVCHKTKTVSKVRRHPGM